LIVKPHGVGGHGTKVQWPARAPAWAACFRASRPSSRATRPGGGIDALRGEPNVQGACDMAVLYNYMPGYLNSESNAEPTIFD
jgi:hypothetical protein